MTITYGATKSMTIVEYRKLARKPAKYRNKRCELDGIRFDSQKEMRRYQDLKLLERAGELTDLRIHPRYDFVVNGVFVGSYRPDFVYTTHALRVVVEDVKSVATRRARDWALRRNLMKAVHGIEVIEV